MHPKLDFLGKRRCMINKLDSHHSKAEFNNTERVKLKVWDLNDRIHDYIEKKIFLKEPLGHKITDDHLMKRGERWDSNLSLYGQ